MKKLLVGCIAIALVGCGGGGETTAGTGTGGGTGATGGGGTGTTGGSGTNPPTIVVPSQADATRFLEQSTFGPAPGDVASVVSVGFDAWLTAQFAQPKTGYSGFGFVPHTAPDTCKYDTTAPTGTASLCARDNYSLFQIQRQFFENALTGSDQLRQRVAFTLSQIFVVSGTDIYEAYGMQAYQNMLLDDAFGNFRQLMTDVTLSPVMGNYLDMVNNDKANATRGTEPNENYARELMQLFSIGVYKLNTDGTEQLDAGGNPIPTYDQGVVQAYARVFTGWTYPPQTGASVRFGSPVNYAGNMVLVAADHDESAKTILNGAVLPAGQTGDQDLSAGLDAIFNHPNMGPFIAKQLIQHLVTSNPTPAYVERVAGVFANNGQNVRGDLKAVVRAILLDSEARGDAKTDAAYGHLREPALLMTSFIRAVGGQSDGVYLRAQVSGMGENIFTSPSVFNFYPPSFTLTGSTTLAPEFGIQDSASSLARDNFLNQLVYGGGAAPDTTVTNSTGTTLDLTGLQALAADPIQLTGELNKRMLHGTLSSSAAQAIENAINVVAASDLAGRARMAAYLFGVMPQYQVEH